MQRADLELCQEQRLGLTEEILFIHKWKGQKYGWHCQASILINRGQLRGICHPTYHLHQSVTGSMKIVPGKS